MTELLRFEARLRRIIASFPQQERALLIDILAAPDSERARAIGRLYQSGRTPSLAELLMDLEEERGARVLVLGVLKEMEMEAPEDDP